MSPPLRLELLARHARAARIVALAAYHRARGGFGRARPFILSHLVTGRCNFRCPQCLWKDNRAETLSTEEIRCLYEQARDQRFIGNYIWGGEPLLREDIGAIVSASRRAGLLTMMNTNGWLLEERLDEVAPAMDLFVVSLDHSQPARHDRLRGVRGSHARVLAGIDAVRRRYPMVRIVINTLVLRGNADDLADMVELWRSLAVPGYVNFIEADLLASDGMGERKAHLDVPQAQRAEIARLLIARKRAGYPILNTERYFRTFELRRGRRRYRCHFPKIFLEIYPDGSVLDCVRVDRPLASVRTQSLAQILGHPRIRGMIEDGERWCCVHNNADRIDSSNLWELRPESLAVVLDFLHRSAAPDRGSPTSRPE